MQNDSAAMNTDMTDLHLSGSDVGSTQIAGDLNQLGASTQESEMCNYEKMYVLEWL